MVIASTKPELLAALMVPAHALQVRGGGGRTGWLGICLAHGVTWFCSYWLARFMVGYVVFHLKHA